MSRQDASDLAHCLGREAEAVCRHYLPAGCQQGNYWRVGDVRGAPGRSMFVRLHQTARGRAGKWSDAATGEHGDLLDVIRETLGLTDFKDVVKEACRFLSLPRPVSEPELPERMQDGQPAPSGSPEAARRLFAMAQPIAGTIAEMYLRNRGITAFNETGALRFHPHCYYRPDETGPTKGLPAMIASVTDLAGRQTGAHRTWLAPDGSGKASVNLPRKSMGNLLGAGVRFGKAEDVLAAGEGLETVLSVRTVLPRLLSLAALSAGHLGAILFPDDLKRLYILWDRDPAGDRARDTLITRANAEGVEAVALTPVLGDFNEDLQHLGAVALRTALLNQLHPEDIGRFLAA
ncbi:hypothetical protein FIV00_26705 [Labrenzia sp. THAF82]|uniref:DUF7146 domain-containing protein n=1 Tax=Labrenzia sp. THAF82 TaxID=2587861 RepID=UPI0012A9A53A|nr:toprim domain-containing protein [Labrenzia sp. THAF82]QFT34115.1 hypothetical protein FIV00_26705 [Labrenzia sp. THAF82]